MTTARVELPDKLVPVFTGPARYRGAYGGRGSGKSFSFAKMLAVRGYARPLRILCGREIQNSIKESSMAEVIRAIDSEPWLARHYDYGESFIRGANGTEFIFTEWVPYLVEGLAPGQVDISLELQDAQGNFIPGPFNSVTRTVTLEAPEVGDDGV